QPEVLIAEARRPGCGQLQLTAIEVDRIGNEAERDRVVGAEQAWTVQVGAAGVSGRALAVVEEAAEMIARTGPWRLDVDAREHRPAPLVVGIAALTRPGLRATRRIVGRVDLVEERRGAKPAPGLVDREVQPRRWMLIGTERGARVGADRNKVGRREVGEPLGAALVGPDVERHAVADLPGIGDLVGTAPAGVTDVLGRVQGPERV